MAKKRSSSAQEPPPTFPSAYWLVALTGVVPALLVMAHVEGVNGPPYWRWSYQDGPFAAYASLALAASGILYWIQTQGESEKTVRQGVIAAALLHLFLTFSFIAFAPDSFANIGGRVRHPDINSYHAEATRVGDVGEWLATFPEKVPSFLLHAKTHPPGPILYYVAWNTLFGERAGAAYGGAFLGLLGALCAPLLFSLVRDVSGSAQAGLCAASLWAIIPGPILMLTSFDAVYPVGTVAMILLWRRALRGSALAALGCGSLLTVLLFFAHNLLVLGAWFVIATVLYALGSRAQGNGGATIRTSLRAIVLGALPVALFYQLLAVTVGYDHLAALKASMGMQELLAGQLHRPYSLTVFWDVYDYFLAGGWVTFALVVLFFSGWKSLSSGIKSFAIAAVATVLIVDVSGLLAAETARVWLFLQPFSLSLAAIELGNRSPGVRMMAYGAIVLALVAIRANMNFI